MATPVSFRSRKEQIEKDFLGRISKVMKAQGTPLNRPARSVIREELRSAAMVGAAEERFRVLRLIKESGVITPEQVCEQPVLAVLGYE